LFSDRPVEVGERACIRLTELSIRWSGVIRLGFTSHDPTSIQTLPKYVCPDLTSKPGYWAKALGERYSESNQLIHYYFTNNGDVYFGVNGVDKGLFFSGVDTRKPLWCLIDLYGNCTAIEMIDMRRSLNNFTPDENNSTPTVTDQAEEVLVSSIDSNTLNLNNLTINNDHLTVPLRFNSMSTFRPLTFHQTTGMNICLGMSRSLAWRHDDEYSNGYVFTGENISVGERIVVQIISTENMYIGSLAFGLTSCDPSSVDTDGLPEDSDMLLDRPEYWIVSKDVANNPSVGDELSFLVNDDGSVEFSKNGEESSVLLYVDCSVPLWAFWDVYGNTQKLRLVGATQDPVLTPDLVVQEEDDAARENDYNNLSMLDLVDPGDGPSTSVDQEESSQRRQDSQTDNEECKICYEATVDCVIYQCGHMCLCYQCALQQWKGRGGGVCPMCRETIQDIIKIYRS